MSSGKKTLLALAGIFVIIQFIQPAKNQSSAATPHDIFELYPAGDDIKQLIKKACYDCHSSNTVYPWYSNIQPLAWWLDHHIDEGKREVNFSEFTTYDAKKQDHKLKETAEEIRKKEMPIPSYLAMHSEARLSSQQREAIENWIAETRQTIVR